MWEERLDRLDSYLKSTAPIPTRQVPDSKGTKRPAGSRPGRREENDMAARSNSNEISLMRVYDAPVRAVWDAWTIPEQVEKWWGPRGFTLTTHSKDLRAGGTWRYTMHGPDGVDYPTSPVPRRRAIPEARLRPRRQR